ncbi:MAG: hypothetical protein HDS35_00050 [Bacteroides sp.]|nr:hypothetical protein [Bacteroides sp.]
MANIASAELNLDYVYSPLSVTAGISVVGNVVAAQVYDASQGVYTPDYTGAFLQLRAWIEADDPDGVLTASDKVLTNLRWYVTEWKTEKQISSGGDYVIDGSLLTVKRNFSPGQGGTFRFEADFLDPRTGEVWQLEASQTVTCESVSAPPVLTLDCADVIRYDPVRDKFPTKKIKATLRVDGEEVPAANREFVWQKRDSDNVWAEIDPSELMDYDVSLNADKSELTVNCEYIGKRIDLRCYAKYNPFGSASGVAITTGTPMKEVSVIRYKAKLSGNILCTRRMKKDQRNLYPEVKIYDGVSEVENPGNVIDIGWRRSTGNKNGTVSKSSVIATGAKPVIPVSGVDVRYGGKLIAEFDVKEPLKALTTADGKVITTADGKVILARETTIK